MKIGKEPMVKSHAATTALYILYGLLGSHPHLLSKHGPGEEDS
jgi:hypothetical protein